MVDPFGPGRSRGWVHSHGATLVELFRLVDLAWIFLGLWLAQLAEGIGWRDDDMVTGLVAVALFTIAAGQWPLYRTWRVASLGAELRRNAWCWLVAATGLAVLAFLLESQAKLSRGVLVVWLVLTLALMLSARIALRLGLRGLRRGGANYRLAAIVGANPTGQAIVEQVVASTWMGIRLVGIFDDRRPDDDRMIREMPIAGTLDELVRRATAGELDIVFIALPLRAELRIRALIHALRDSTVTVMYVPNFDAFGLLSARWEVFRGIPMISLVDTPHHGGSGLSKRLFDLVGASLLLLLLALPMLGIALAVRRSSPGPALFRQKRYGLDGREILVYKFRTMSVTEDGKAAFTQARKGDARVTPLGAFLRRTSLDELPQLINVLQGRMSIVGPRPHPVALNESHRRKIEGYMLRHKVRPGITGWAQVNGCRGETSTPDKMANRIRYDLEYINNWSLALDLRILWMTLFSVIDDPNAY
ncbi:MAG: undecaprenyl-phosphate glucose phosphotransferase [Burkholderiales bacterium RIFCSPHIGHO2_12_FULL_69_20]|nr:MAG: undecaprenyl-phosphate glucose phosphotransferase [Burkholderiales bacterium RIFCSPHIGHO2_12_FULL_69_20]